MGNELRGRYQQFGIDYVVEHGRADSDAVIDAVFETFGDELRTEWERLAREGVRRDLKTAFKRLESDDEAEVQTGLPGFTLPKIIALPREGGAIEYIDSLTASREDAQAARLVRVGNILNAQRKLEQWDQTLDRLRPAWNLNPEWTIGECVDYLANVQ